MTDADIQAEKKRANEVLHTNIGFANQYRMELIKTTLTVAVALLAFTATFRPNIVNPAAEYLMWLGWISLGLAAIGAMGNMYGWEQFYISYRDHKDNYDEGKAARKIITCWRRTAMWAQFVGFAVGVLSIAIFAAANLSKVKVQQP